MIEQESVLYAVFVAIFYTILSMTDLGHASIVGNNNEFEFMVVNGSNCTCEGHNQVYEYRVSGSGTIVWRGTAFDCSSSSNEIVLSQSRSGPLVCNNGAISGRIVRAENNTYISQLTVLVSAEMVGTTISCFHDSGAVQNLIGSSLLTLTTDPYPPPNDTYLMATNSSQLTFQWSSVTTTCEAIHYHINASGCGHCPDVTNDTTISCRDFSLDNQVCLLAVKTVVCDNITGNESRGIQVTLRAPDSPEIDVIPTYSYNSKTLLRLTTRFNETEAFNISDQVDGSSLSYTINYNNSNSGALCKTDRVIATSCMNGSCEYDDLSPLSTCTASYITVTVSGINMLGSGPPSNASIIPGKSDHFVDVLVDLASKTVTCSFHQQTENCEKYCSIEYGPSRENCSKPQNPRKFANRSTSGNVVLFTFNDSDQFQPQEEYCFTVTASNGTFTVLIEGTTIVLDTLTDASSTVLGTVAALVVFVAIIAITLLGVLITIFVIVKKKLKIRNGEAQFTSEAATQRSTEAVNNDVDPQGINETNEQGIGIYSLLQSVGDETPESQTTHPDPVYVDIGPSTTSYENAQMILVPSCDVKVEYAKVKQIEKRKINTDSKQVLLDKHLDLDNLLIQLRDDVTPHWYEFGVIVGVPREIMDKCKDYPPDQCIVEVLDYWLMHHRGQLTWRDVAHALKEIQLHHLAEYILQNS